LRVIKNLIFIDFSALRNLTRGESFNFDPENGGGLDMEVLCGKNMKFLRGDLESNTVTFYLNWAVDFSGIRSFGAASENRTILARPVNSAARNKAEP